MRGTGRATVNTNAPRAHAICDRCGFRYNHYELRWQFQYQGPRLQNIRILVCSDCYDIPQQQLRTIILPPDPLPISDPRPENYVSDDNPLSGIGIDPNFFRQAGTNIGNMTQGAGTAAAFDGNLNKPRKMCAQLSPSSTSSTVGVNWSKDPASVPTPAELTPQTLTNTAAGFTLTAPNDSAFLAGATVNYLFQGSSNGTNWTTLYTGTTAGTVGETVSVTSLSGTTAYQYHQILFQGDGVNKIAISQLQINVSNSAGAS